MKLGKIVLFSAPIKAYYAEPIMQIFMLLHLTARLKSSMKPKNNMQPPALE
ncbi:MAG: hypothetical protein ACR5K7_04855 [Symbiopectobacterium sp.]